MNTPRISIVLIFLMLFTRVSFAEPAAGTPQYFELIPTDIAVGDDNSCVLRDRYGFLWVGSSKGLRCYDGNGTEVYHSGNDPLRVVSNLYISSLSENGDDIWIGTNAGLYVFDRAENSVSHFSHKTKYGVTISALVENMMNVGQGRTWISTQGQGFFIYNKISDTLEQNSRHGSFYSDMTVGANGLLYLASINGLVQMFKPNGEFVSELRLPDFVADKSNISMAASGRDIWISSGSNLYRLDTDTGIIQKEPADRAMGIINKLYPCLDGTLLLGTNSGLWSFNTVKRASFKRLFSARNTADNADVRVVDMLPDVNNDIIVMRSNGTLDILARKSYAFNFVPVEAGDMVYGHNYVHAIALDSVRGALWVGSDSGLDYYDLATGRFDKSMVPSIGERSVSALAVDGDKLWIGTRSNGVVLYDIPSRGTRTFTYSETEPYTVISNEINNIHRTLDGEIYILTNWGVCRYDAAADNFPQYTEIGQQSRGICMEDDASGDRWIATANNGIYHQLYGRNRYDSEGRMDNGEYISAVMMLIDNKERLWVITRDDGLFIYDKTDNSFRPCDVPQLKHKSPAFMAEDRDGSLLIGMESYILKMRDGKAVDMYNFGTLSDRQPVAGVMETLGDGRVVIGCRDGLLILDPAKMKSNGEQVAAYPGVISFPTLADDSRKLTARGLDKLLYKQKTIELPYSHNTFSIHLEASRPVTSPAVRYDYMLDGIDKTWITGMASDEVTYNNLAPGEYTFLLRPHSVKDGIISSVSIIVLPPWYRTTWAYIVYGFLGLLFILAIILVARKLTKRKYVRQLQNMRIQKEREVFEAKSRYFVDLVHEIRTPLMLISLPLEQLAEENGTRPDAKKNSSSKYIKSMQRNIEYLLGITNQLLDFRRAENSRDVQLALTRCNINRLLRDICRRFDEPLKISGKKINLSLPANDIVATIDADKSERLLMNLIGNAMKYARHEISVSLLDNDGSFSVSVGDDGPGVPAEERERIFDAYYQIGKDNVAASLGTGLGLAYAKLIAVAHKGSISVTDNAGGGALFTLTLPKGDDIVLTESAGATEDIEAEDIEVSVDKSITILLVEDNDELRTMISDTLGRRYNVITAIDGFMALDILGTCNVDVIVSDVMMPRMNGLELCRRVKNDLSTSHIPFIILSAKTGREAQAEGMAAGADVYLEKPFPIRQLSSQISNLLRTRQLFREYMRNEAGIDFEERPVAVGGTSGLNKRDAEFLEKMNSIITESIASEEFSIDSLAEKLNLSRSSFYRKITAIVGMSPSDYLKSFRLNHATVLLKEGCRVTEVADRVGFTSSSYFAKCFKDKFGVLPSDYVDSLKSEGRAKDGK